MICKELFFEDQTYVESIESELLFSSSRKKIAILWIHKLYLQVAALLRIYGTGIQQPDLGEG